MDHFLHHNHRSSRYVPLPPPHQPPNRHHLRNHVLMASNFHPLHPQPPPRVYTLFPPFPQTSNPNYDSVPASTLHIPRDSDIQSNFEGYDERHEIVEKDSNRFAKHWKKPTRVLPRFELGNRDIGDDGNSRGKKEHTKKKQVQRKSAFLRIRKPNQWIREIEHSDSNKDQHGNLGNGVKEEKREGSLVELDISFESNAMVAKAIVPPSSSVGVSKTVADTVLGTNLTPSRKSKKALSVISGSQVTKQSAVAVSSNSLACKASATSGAGNEVILPKNVSDACSQQCLGSADNLQGKNNMAQSSMGIGLDESNSPVTKADVPLSDSVCSDSQLAKLLAGAESSNSLPCKAGGNSSSDGDVLLQKNVSHSWSRHCLLADHNPHDKNKAPKSSKGIVSDESNSLVAEAVVSPSSTVIFNTNMTLVSHTNLMSKRKRKKMRKMALISNSFCSDSKLAILSTGAVNSNSSLCKASGSSGSGKDMNSQKDVSDTCSQPYPGAAYNPHPRGKNEVLKSSKGIVSDESNSLVAKAGVPPPSSVIVSDTNLMSKRQRKKMRRKALISNSPRSGSPLAILSTGFVSLNSSQCKAIDNPSSGKDVILAKNVSDTCSQPRLGAADNLRGKNEVVKSSKGIVSDKSNSLVAKAGVPPTSSVIVSDTNLMSKRQRKKLRKKALISNSAYSGSQLAILSTGFVSSNSSLCKAIDNPSSGKDVIAANNVSATCSQPCLGVAQNPRANNEVAKSSKGIVLDGSNSLEAKAVVPPLNSVIFNSDKTVVSDTNLAPKINLKKKREKALISDSVCSVSQLANLSTVAVISNSLPCRASETSSSGKNVILPKNVSNTCSQPCLAASHNPHGKDEVAHSSEGIVSDEIVNVDSGKTSVRVVKKKRIVKRVVRRVVVNPKSNVPSSVSTNMLDGKVKVDGVTLSSPTASASGKIETSLNKKSATFENISISNCLQSLPSEGNHYFCEDKKCDVPLVSLGTHPRSRECKSGRYSDLGIERPKSSSCDCGNIENKRSVSDCLNGDISAHGLLRIPNIDMVTNSLNGSISSEINHLVDFNKQLCQGEVFPSPVKYLSVANEMNSATDGVTGLSLNNLKVKSEENFTVCDIGNDSIAGKLYCENEPPTLSQDVILKENPDIAITVPSSGMVDISSLSKTSIKEGPDFVQHANVLAKWGSSSNNESTNSEYSISFPRCGIMNDIEKQMLPSNAFVFPIAVCTKFLNGSCSNPYCKLTHKVIPERMPDCSYFLQGLCTNRNCSYRHVNVNPKASICEGFLKGYCAKGNECRKKHSYVCPTFEATENCNQGTGCKLRHPKKEQGTGKKRKRSGDHNNDTECYFGSIPIDFSEPGMMVGQRQQQQNNENEGEIADYISFEVDEGVAESADQSYEEATLCDSNPLDLEMDNLDELIKPVLIMNRNFMAQSSPVPVL
ncbi:hypothetical protein Lal_00002063 [Lupinus albus]|uniref:Putative transcription factor C3H family n=1 Tax=Lupinus albus TaxID=3870 RepID=A0A6A4PRD0_LUPAL|nr:putative transcription factor C3H family [Lupinus albus]KAF1893571.1 hypothetical protein Lal_00002063 [Lupinus albus]